MRIGSRRVGRGRGIQLIDNTSNMGLLSKASLNRGLGAHLEGQGSFNKEGGSIFSLCTERI